MDTVGGDRRSFYAYVTGCDRSQDFHRIARGLTDPLIVRERLHKLLAQYGTLVHPALGCAWL